MVDTLHKILVVDDEASAFEVIEALLQREGYELTYLASGMDALIHMNTLYQTSNAIQLPDVILMDIMMPDVDGLEVCRQFKANPHWRHIPIIMVTALHSKADLAHALDAGGDDFISKPVNGQELRARVRSMLRIKQQYDALEATLQIREDLSHMVVHDLRTPLTNILLSSQLLLSQGTLEGKTLERVQLIQSSGKKLSSMIDDLLILAKMESGKLVLNRSEVPIPALLNYAIENFQAIADSRNIKFNIQSYQPELLVWVDTNLVQRLLENLISNAVKFSEPGETVNIQTQPIEPSTSTTSNPQVLISIADRGPGISPEVRDRIFNKFEIGNVISSASQVGLGLTFCKLVAEAHGGYIDVEANTPHGSIFIVQL